jgi:hypothetical protein
MGQRHRILGALAVVALARVAGAAVTAAPGWAVRTIPAPAVVAGGVVARDGAVLVGQGSFGAGLQTIVRIDAGGATTIATGFNSLGGFDLDAAGTLWVVDNGGELGGATSGDTLYAIPDALTRTTALAAASATVLPNGTIPFAQDALVVPGGVLVADAAGPGMGRVVHVAGAVPTTLISGLDFLGGLALDGATLLVGNLDGSFTGNVLRYTLAGAPLGPLATGLPASYGVVVDADGHVLTSGEFSFDCTAGRILAIPPGGGTPVARATGFCSAADLYFDADRDEVLALDFGVTVVTAICRDADGDASCDADDACVGAGALADVRVRVKGLPTPPGGNDALQVSADVPVAGTLDPVATGLRLRLEAADGRAVVDAVLPPGAYDRALRRGWRARPGSWKWRDKAGVAGIVSAKVRTVPTMPGTAAIAVKGRRGSYSVFAGDLPLALAIGLDPGGQCGTGTVPGCEFVGGGEVLSCR